MGISRRRNWLRFLRSSRQKTIVIVHSDDNTSDVVTESGTPLIQAGQDSATKFSISSDQKQELVLDGEATAAVKIQSYFRRHLARRAFRALRGLVKLQALVRGVCVRRQARIAMHFMHALARLQITVRARQLLTR